jgi:hypothetical protein
MHFAQMMYLFPTIATQNSDRVYIPRNRVARLYSQALGSHYVASCDSQGCGWDILTLPKPGGPGWSSPK